MSTNEELPTQPTPPKHRISPLEFRNTDLVSRLLAATPPYLYNMPLVPHSYFFSEMLRSFVQAKAQENNRNNNNNSTNLPNNNTGNMITQQQQQQQQQHQQKEQHHQQRRSRKRSWNQMKSIDQLSNNTSGWQQKHSQNEQLLDHHNNPEETSSIWSTSKTVNEKPLELTINKISNSNKIVHKISDLENNRLPEEDDQISIKHNSTICDNNNLAELRHPNNPLITPSMPLFTGGSMETQPNDLILPPPPPIWYPPIYPSPYGIDPLHFFIDLRVSGHIYDRKKDGSNHFLNIEKTETPDEPTDQQTLDVSSNTQQQQLFKPTRHTSAFSVPVRNISVENNGNNAPINLTNDHSSVHKDDDQTTASSPGKFIGEMKTEMKNKVSTHYVMQNLQTVYNKILEKQSELADHSSSNDQCKDDKRAIEMDGIESHYPVSNANTSSHNREHTTLGTTIQSAKSESHES